MATSEFTTSLRERALGTLSYGVSWTAVTGGAFATASIWLLLLALGAGFGLSAVSPWSNAGASAAALGTAAIVWLIVTQVIASAMGGYLAGRLRTKWQSVHNDEVHFRDTANGFLVWAVAVVMSAAFLSAAATFMASGVAAGETAAADRGASNQPGGTGYFVDKLFRSDRPATAEDASVRAEAGRIFVNILRHSDTSRSDTNYLAQLVAARTGINLADAETRVNATVQDALQAEDTARKATARLLLWISVVLLLGALSASYAATVGGRQRDHVQMA